MKEQDAAVSHMLVFLQENDQEELNQSVMHGRRAFYDAQRFMLLFLMRDAQAIRDGMGEHIPLYVDLVSKTYSEGKYSQLKKGLLAAKAYIQQMAQIKTDSKRWQNRGESFAACKPHIEALKEYVEVYETLSDEFIRIRKAEELRLQKEAQDKKRKYVLGVLGLLVALAGVIATIIFTG